MCHTTVRLVATAVVHACTSRRASPQACAPFRVSQHGVHPLQSLEACMCLLQILHISFETFDTFRCITCSLLRSWWDLTQFWLLHSPGRRDSCQGAAAWLACDTPSSPRPADAYTCISWHSIHKFSSVVLTLPMLQKTKQRTWEASFSTPSTYTTAPARE